MIQTDAAVVHLNVAFRAEEIVKCAGIAGCVSCIRTTYLLNTNHISVSQLLALGSTPECSRSNIIALFTKSCIMCRLCRPVRY
jgi:hypothetical protein